MDKKIGYIIIEFLEKQKLDVINWSKNIGEENLYSVLQNGKTEGGNITDDLHLTLFYGLNEDKINQNDLNSFIGNINIENVEINGLGVFPVPDQSCKILYLSINDESGNLKKYHNNFKDFCYFEEYQKNTFAPHITIAYVKEEFDINKVVYTGPKILNVKNIIHKIKSV